MGQRYANPRELMEMVSQIRRDHSAIRRRIAMQNCICLAYANGRHWQDVGNDRNGDANVSSWQEDWDLRSTEMRVTDNRIGPLLRQIRATTNASGVQARVRRPNHVRDFNCTEKARSAELLLNGIEKPAAMTKAYRAASSLRWATGSALMVLRTVRKTSRLSADVVTNPDGTPVEIDDSWIRWRRAALTDLIWDPSNLSPDLDDHEILVLEQAVTQKTFEREFGPVERWGIDPKSLPKMGTIAPHYTAAANVAGSSIYGAYAASSQTPALRLITVCECGPDSAPGRFPCCWHIIDTSASVAATNDLHGTVVNWDNPYGQYGDIGRPFVKLDGFRRDDSVDAVGVPGVLMTHNDLLNIARSIQFQQMVSVVHGHWLVDSRAANKDEFTNSLNQGIGGVLSWNSNGGTTPMPTFVHPQPPDQTWPIIGADLAQTMMSQVHQTQQSLGVAKTHVPQEVQMAMLENSGVVIDQVVMADTDEIATMLRVTLGSMQRAIAKGGSALGYLRDQHGFSKEDVLNVLDIDPDMLGLDVRPEQSSLVARSVSQRATEINNAMMTGQITPTQASIAVADELGRPIVQEHQDAIEFARSGVRTVIDGQDWPGVPSLDSETFARVARSAIFKLRIDDPDDVDAIHRLETAIQTQAAIGRENPELQAPQFANQQGGGNNQQTAGVGSQRSQGAPGSINPQSSPIGAAGGLPLGLPPSIA